MEAFCRDILVAAGPKLRVGDSVDFPVWPL